MTGMVLRRKTSNQKMGQRFLDQYSVLHYAQGVIAYFLNTPPFLWFISHATFEFLENTGPGMHFINTVLKDAWPGGKPEADSVLNVLGDNLAAQVGYWSARSLDLNLRKS